MKYIIDIDGTLNEVGNIQNFGEDYLINLKPRKDVINKVNKLFDEGHMIILQTARSKWMNYVTTTWLMRNNVKYHDIIYERPYADYYIDDRGITPEEFIKCK